MREWSKASGRVEDHLEDGWTTSQTGAAVHYYKRPSAEKQA